MHVRLQPRPIIILRLAKQHCLTKVTRYFLVLYTFLTSIIVEVPSNSHVLRFTIAVTAEKCASIRCPAWHDYVCIHVINNDTEVMTYM